LAFHASNNALGYNAFSAQAADFSEVESGVLRRRVRGNASTFMIHEMVFDPTELRTVGTVFDEAWEALRTQHENAKSLDETRLRLASLVLRLASDRQLGQQQIKATALRMLTHDDL
jgi:hypothetical protein